MFGNPFSPYWWMPQLPVMPQPAIRRVDIGGIYELSTNARASYYSKFTRTLRLAENRSPLP